MIVVSGVGSQPTLGTGLTVVSSFVEALNPHRIGLKEFFKDVAIGIIESTTGVSAS